MASGSALRGVIAIDGPSGTGKSTVARGLARHTGARYLDTGAMYRAVTLAVLHAGADVGDVAAVLAVVDRASLAIGTDPRGEGVLLDGADVATEIRGPRVTGAVSAVSALPPVRSRLVAAQRRIIADELSQGAGIVVEGRDIGTVVAPDAPLKVFLTASARVRAARRCAQDRAAGRVHDVEQTLRAVRQRDALDSGRVDSPLRAAPDAVVVDTTELSASQTIDRLTELAHDRGLLACDVVENGTGAR